VVENADSSTISLMVPSKDGQVAGVGRAESTCLGKIWEKNGKNPGKNPLDRWPFFIDGGGTHFANIRILGYFFRESCHF
jgi:hypothetical protein